MKPFTIMSLGPLLLGLTLGAVVLVDPMMRNVRGVLIGVVCGTTLGLFMFAPFAAGEVLRPRFVGRHLAQLDRWSAMLLAMGLGHCVFSRVGDYGLLIAFAVIVAAALFRVYLGVYAQQRANAHG
jgi:hypothetical protein